jgi:hypothetical protein
VLFSFFFLLLGCLSLLENEKLVILPHFEQYAAEIPDGVYTPANYTELRNWMMNLIHSGREEGTVSLIRYSGNRDEDLRTIMGEWRTDPIGDFAVDFISRQQLGRYVWSYFIHYRRTQEEVSGIRRVTGAIQLDTQIRLALHNADARLVVETDRYNERDFNIAAMFDRILLEESSLCVPPVPPVVTLFPDSGNRRIVEIVFQYGGNPQQILQNRRAAQNAAYTILDSIELEGLEPFAQAVLLAEALAAHIDATPPPLGGRPPHPDDVFAATAYGALVLRRTDPRGMALAFKLLGNAAGLDVYIVSGQLERGAHVWNLVAGEDFGAHVDFSIDRHGDYPPRFQLDSEMTEAGYSWDTWRYPTTPEEWPGHVSAIENDTYDTGG